MSTTPSGCTCAVSNECLVCAQPSAIAHTNRPRHDASGVDGLARERPTPHAVRPGPEDLRRAVLARRATGRAITTVLVPSTPFHGMEAMAFVGELRALDAAADALGVVTMIAGTGHTVQVLTAVTDEELAAIDAGMRAARIASESAA